MRISCVLLYSLFLSPKSVSAVRLYGDETDIRRLCAFLSVSLHETLKKGRPKIAPIIKLSLNTIKFSPAFFQKAAQSRTRSSCRAPQSAKFLLGVFFFIAFSFAPAYAKEKADERLNFFFWMLT